MIGARRVLAVLGSAAVIAGCAAGHGQSAGSTRTPGRTAAHLVPAWTAALNAVESPQATAGGFAFHALTAQGTFEVVSVAAADGRVRWRADASPSQVAPGVGLSVAVVDGGKTVVWMSPGAASDSGDVTIMAADAATGRIEWSYGAGAYLTSNPPIACASGGQICLVGAAEGAGATSLTALDARTGRVLAQHQLPSGSSARALGGEVAAGSSVAPGTATLLDTEGTLTGVDFERGVLWSRLDSAVFGGQRVSPNDGWDLQGSHGRWLGSLGYEGVSDSSTPVTTYRFPAEPGASAAFDMATGRTLWIRPNTQVDCGSLSLHVAHPVLCSGPISIDYSDPTHPKALSADITLAGVDPATGRTTWSWHAGNVPGLVVASDDVIQVDDTHYAVRRGQTVTTLDLERGPSTAAGTTTGWCAVLRGVRTSLRIYSTDPDIAYTAAGIHPCSVGGQAVTRPATTPAFAGGSSAGTFAWTDETGTVHAVRL